VPLTSTRFKRTKLHFNVLRVVADKGYNFKNNYEFVDKIGAVAFIAFPKNVKGLGGGMYSKMYGHFLCNREDFLEQYHRRSNVEAAFSTIKRRFREVLRSRTDTAMKNEALCKFLCHNIVLPVGRTLSRE
jgi:transposase